MSHLKLIVLPSASNIKQIGDSQGSEEKWSLVSLPQPRTSQLVRYLHCSEPESLFELKRVSGSNPHLKYQQKLELDSGKAVKSIILEDISTQRENNTGVVISDPSIYVTTPFNITYILIYFFTNTAKKLGERSVSLEDIDDSLADNAYGQMGLLSGLVPSALETICDTITEGGDKYYRFSSSKCLEFLREKTVNLSENFPSSIFNKVVMPKIVPADIEKTVDPSIVAAAKLFYAAIMVSSYLTHELSTQLQKSFQQKISGFQQYVKEQEEVKRKRAAAEQQMKEMNEELTKTTKTSKPPSKTKKAAAKPKKKVSKGAIDSFFTKKS